MVKKYAIYYCGVLLDEFTGRSPNEAIKKVTTKSNFEAIELCKCGHPETCHDFSHKSECRADNTCRCKCFRSQE
jgi:hypothetical protein